MVSLLVDGCTLEVVEAATSIYFDRGRSRGGGKIAAASSDERGRNKKQSDTRRPAFSGALLDILPRCIGITDSREEVKKGYYSTQLSEEIGDGAYNHDGHRNARFLESKRLGPYPTACIHAWEHLRLDADYRCSITILSSSKE
jgi:hypothetical protein